MDKQEQRAEMARRIAELETILQSLVDEAQDSWDMGDKGIKASVTWGTIHKAQRILEDK